jgi:hypothetical protein
MRSAFCAATLIALFGLVSGCGGGGGGGGGQANSSPATTDIQAVGIYSAKVVGGAVPIFQTLVLNYDGKFAVYYEDGFGGRRGFADGSASVSGGSFSGSMTDYSSSGVANGTVSGTYRPGNGVSVQVVYPSGSSTLTYSFVEYPTLPQATADAVGTWSSGDEANAALVVTIGASGTVTATYGSGCAVNGSLFRPAGYNTVQLANVSGTASGNCRFGTGPMAGLMRISYLSGGVVSLFGHLIRSDRADGFEFHSYRCANGKTMSQVPLLSC